LARTRAGSPSSKPAAGSPAPQFDHLARRYRVTLAGARFARFCRLYVRQTKGRWAGQPLILEPWQVGLYSELLRCEPENSFTVPRTIGTAELHAEIDAWVIRLAAAEKLVAGDRVYQEAYVQITKKTGKSTTAAGLGLYFTAWDGEAGAEVYAAARDRQQARIVFEQARQYVLRSPRLADTLKLYRDAIAHPESDSVFRVLSADAAAQEGLNPSAVIIDELHRHPNRDLYDTLRQGAIGAARSAPMVITITNAGSDLDGTICGEVYRRGEAGTDPRLFFFAPQLPDNELADPKKWKKVNPASWITLDGLKHQAETTPRFVFQRFRLNRWTAADDSWLPGGLWDSLADLDVELGRGQPIVVTVDAAMNRATTAVTWGGLVDGKIVARMHAWGVHEDPTKPPPPAHSLVSEGPLPLEPVEAFIERLHEEYDVLEVAYDPWRFERSAEIMVDRGINAVRFDQTNERMCPASERLFNVLVEHRCSHNGDPHFKAQIEAATVKDTGRGWRLFKHPRRYRPMDAAVGLAILVDRIENQPPPRRRPTVSAIL
jgi:phage terminase large subunit-like protein